MAQRSDPHPLIERRARARNRALVVDDDVDAPFLDLVVLDYEMPLLNGLETLQALRAMQPGLKALLCVREGEAIRPEGLPEGTAFLKKPFTLHGLAKGLDKLHRMTRHNLEHGRVASSHWIRLSGEVPHYPPR